MTRVPAWWAVAFVLSLSTVSRAEAEPPPVCHGKDLTHVVGLEAAKARRADDLLNADGLLWRVEKPGLAPSFLYGTIHSTDDSAIAMARRAGEEISAARVVATELGGPMDATEKANAGAMILAKALDADHDTFETLPKKDRALVENFATDQGYPSEFSHHLKLWFLAIATATPPCEAKRQALALPEVDEFLAETAKRSGVKVVGLETAAEQIDAISTMRPDVATTLLTVAARDLETNDDVYATMLRLYRESRPAEILPIGDIVGDMTDVERGAEDEFKQLLLIGRNATMAKRSAELLKDGGAFIAVGALHLPGKDGLIERVREAGYVVTKVW
jgi:uncharacterized protein YbaP (TraB family)